MFMKKLIKKFLRFCWISMAILMLGVSNVYKEEQRSVFDGYTKIEIVEEVKDDSDK